MNATTPPKPADSPPPRLAALRRWQIRSVALGCVGGLMFLLGLSLGIHEAAWAGLGLFIAGLLLIVVLGGAAWWNFG